MMVKKYPHVPTAYSSLVETKMLCKESKSDLMAFESDKLTAELQRWAAVLHSHEYQSRDKTTMELKFTTISQIAYSCVWSVPLSFFDSMNLSWVCTCRKWFEGLTNLFSTHQFIYIHLLHVFIAGSNEWKRLEVDQWPPERFDLYRNLSKICPWGMNLSGSSKRRWVYFWVVILLSPDTPTSHTVYM